MKTQQRGCVGLPSFSGVQQSFLLGAINQLPEWAKHGSPLSVTDTEPPLRRGRGTALGRQSLILSDQ